MLPEKINTFLALANRCLRIVPNPKITDLSPYAGLADPKDIPILVSALQNNCAYLVSHNVRHFQPGHPDLVVVTPDEFILKVRDILSLM